MKFFRKRKWTRNRLKSLRMHHLHPFFSKNFSPPPPPVAKGYSLTHPHRRIAPEVGLQSPPTVDIVSRSIIDNAMYIFNAILLKIQLSLSEFKRLYLHSRLHHFAPFFQNFLGEVPRPPPTGGDTLPYPPHSALRASRTPPPRLTSGSATVPLIQHT